MDFPTFESHKPTICTFSAEMLGVCSFLLTGNAGASSAAWPSSNLGIYIPLALRTPYLVKQVFWVNGTSVTGNVDCGIYSVGGTLLTSIGPTAQSGTSTIQAVVLSTAILLTPGSYYMALSSSSSSATFNRLSCTAVGGQAMGSAQQASVGTLPATASFASFAQTVIPLIGIASAGVI